MADAEILNDPDIQRIPWEEIEVSGKIGAGASGMVRKGVWRHREGAKPVAVKELLFGLDFDPKMVEDFLREIKLMSYVVRRGERREWQCIVEEEGECVSVVCLVWQVGGDARAVEI